MEIDTNTLQVVDPAVTQGKFNAEVEQFRIVEHAYKMKGIICTGINYPDIDFIFCANKVSPAVIGFAVRINFSNYDAEPPSVTFIDPFSGRSVKREEIPLAFIQFGKGLQAQDLLQGGGSILPFFCIPGVREYHNHPAHSGDSWFLYRKTGEGSLPFILDQLYNHSVAAVRGYLFQHVAPKVQLNQEFVFTQPINQTK